MRTARLLPISPSMHCSRGVVYLLGGHLVPGVYLVWRDVCVPGLGGVPCPRGCTCPGVYLVGGCTWSGGCTCQGTPGPGGCTCLGDVPAQGGTGRGTAPLLWTEWQSGVKILPCPKLRLQAVIISRFIWFLLVLMYGIMYGSSGGSKGDVRDAPPGIQILSISCSFWENLAKSYVGALSPPPGGLVPPPLGNPRSATGSRFGLRLNLSLHGWMAIRRQNSYLEKSVEWPNGDSVTVLSPNCHSDIQTQTQTQMEPEQ